MEWYFNNQRFRHWLPDCYLQLLGAGTGANESIHHEINMVSKNQPEWFATTAELQLGTTKVAKNVAHNSAMYHPTLRQMNPSMVLHRRVASIGITESAWVAFCQQLCVPGRRTLTAAHTPLFRRRQIIASRIKLHAVRRRPAAAMKVIKTIFAKKRTAFTRRRVR